MTRLSVSDRALIRAAEAEIRRRYRPHWHELAAAVRTSDGRVVVGVHIDAYASICAEAAAIARAVSEGAEGIETIVAVRYLPETDAVEVVAPCGTCRELIADFGDVEVIHRDGRGWTKTRAAKLLPSRYVARRAEDRRRGRAARRRGARGGEKGGRR